MKRILKVLAVTLTAAMSLASCGTDEPTTSSTESGPLPTGVEVTPQYSEDDTDALKDPFDITAKMTTTTVATTTTTTTTTTTETTETTGTDETTTATEESTVSGTTTTTTTTETTEAVTENETTTSPENAKPKK